MMKWVDVSSFSSQYLETDLLTRVSPDGFFDAGMLLQALKARSEQFESAETRASERAAAAQARRRDIGKKLRLSDY
jgi:hypothetical protein